MGKSGYGTKALQTTRKRGKLKDENRSSNCNFFGWLFYLYNSTEEPFSKFSRYILLMAVAIIAMTYLRSAKNK